MTHDAPFETPTTIPTRIHQVLDHWVREQPQAPALRDASVCLNYAQVDAATRAVADQLTALSVRAGDRVLVVGENCAALGVLVMAISRIDAWFSLAHRQGVQECLESKRTRRRPLRARHGVTHPKKAYI